MRLFRIAEEQFAADLTGEGARLYGGRWNPKGIPMIYTAESVALAALEVLVRLSAPKHYSRVVYELPDTSSCDELSIADLPTNWQLPYPNIYLIDLGKRWAQEKRSLLLRVPSAVVCGEGWNYMINPHHAEFGSVSIADSSPFAYDSRLLKT